MMYTVPKDSNTVDIGKDVKAVYSTATIASTLQRRQTGEISKSAI